MIVIKYGGHALPRAGVPDEILKTIADFHLALNRVVLVHGGGPQVDAELEIHGIPTEMISGYRHTSPAVFEVVQKVLSGQVLRTLVNQMIGYGVNAVGLSAGDGETIRATKMEPIVNGVPVDIGLVGDASKTDPSFLNLLLNHGYLPVISPVGVNSKGQGLNLNGDLAAGAKGIYRNFPDESSLITLMSASELKSLQTTFHEGMIPKSKAALAALDAGARSVRVIDGRDAAHLKAALQGHGGTVIRND